MEDKTFPLDIRSIIKSKGVCDMLRLIIFLVLDGLFINILVTEWNGLEGYLYLLLGIVAYFTWEVIRTIKHIFGK